VLIAQGKPFLKFWGALLSYVGAVLPTFAIVTIVFAVLDIGNSKFRLSKERPRQRTRNFTRAHCPMLRPASIFLMAKPIRVFKTAFELFFSAAFLLWWMRVSMIRKLAAIVWLGPVGLSDKIPVQLGPGVGTSSMARDFSFARGDRAADRYVHLSGSPQVLFANETDYERRQRVILTW